jgi:hypothetical protein
VISFTVRKLAASNGAFRRLNNAGKNEHGGQGSNGEEEDMYHKKRRLGLKKSSYGAVFYPVRETAMQALEAAARTGLCTVRTHASMDPLKEYGRQTEGYFDALGKYAFVAAPAGHGIDTHRVWDSLYAGAVPIVASSGLDSLYRSLPVIILPDWDVLRRIFSQSAALAMVDEWKQDLATRFGPGDPFSHAQVRQRLTAEYWTGTVRKWTNLTSN